MFVLYIHRCVAEGDLRVLRIASHALRRAVDQRSDLMRRMRSHLTQLAVSFAKGDWQSVVGRQRITTLVDQAEAAQGLRGQAIARLWRRIQALDEAIEHWSRQAPGYSAPVRWAQQPTPIGLERVGRHLSVSG